MSDKLNPSVADLIRCRWLLGKATAVELAERFGCSLQSVHNICRCRSYRTPLALWIYSTLPARHDPPTRLTAMDVVSIREFFRAGCSQAILAELLNLPRLTVHRIAKRKSYRWITASRVNRLREIETELETQLCKTT